MINYQLHADIAIYPYESLAELISDERGYALPDGALEFTSRAIVRTRYTGQRQWPTALDIITKLNHRSYDGPRLVAIKDSQTIVSVMLPRASGTIGGVTELFIVIMPPGTYVWPYKEHPELRSEMP
jgi:hypothetical protein